MMEEKIKLEKTVCNNCGSQDYDTFLSRGDLNTYLPGVFTLVRCRNCKLVYQNPRPTKESSTLLYPNEYDQYLFDSKKRIALLEFFKHYGLRKRVNLVLKYKQKGTLCDLGCATGDFLSEMANQKDWELLGIEPNLGASAYARSMGLNVISNSLENIDLPPEQFDVVTLWNVIEHLYDPADTLNRIAKLLKKDGILIITTPNLGSIDSKVFGKYWIGYELPRHFYIYSKSTIQELVNQTGYYLRGSYYIYGSHASFMSSLRFWMRGKLGIRNRMIEDLLFSLPIRVLMSPLFYLFDKMKLTSSMTVVCQKKSK